MRVLSAGSPAGVHIHWAGGRRVAPNVLLGSLARLVTLVVMVVPLDLSRSPATVALVRGGDAMLIAVSTPA